MKNTERIEKIRSDTNLSKPNKPYIMDINTKRKVLFDEQKKRTEIGTPNTIKKNTLVLPSHLERIAYFNKITDFHESPKETLRNLPAFLLKNENLKHKSNINLEIAKHALKSK